jgi:hypothetical protein
VEASPTAGDEHKNPLVFIEEETPMITEEE